MNQSSSPFNYKLKKKYLPYSAHLHLFVIVDQLYYYYTLRQPPIGRASLPLGLMYHIPGFEELPTMPPVDSVGDSGTLSLVRAGGDSGMGEVTFISRRI